jgi:hypothetical protein
MGQFFPVLKYAATQSPNRATTISLINVRRPMGLFHSSACCGYSRATNSLNAGLSANSQDCDTVARSIVLAICIANVIPHQLEINVTVAIVIYERLCTSGDRWNNSSVPAILELIFGNNHARTHLSQSCFRTPVIENFFFGRRISRRAMTLEHHSICLAD